MQKKGFIRNGAIIQFSDIHFIQEIWPPEESSHLKVPGTRLHPVLPSGAHYDTVDM